MFGFSRRQTITLVILTVGTFITVFNQMIVSPALPTIMREMSVSASTVQWLTTGFTMVNAVMIPITAYLTNRYSIRSLFLTVMVVFTAGTLLVASGPTFGIVLAGRLVQAMGAGILMPLVMTVLLLTFPVEHRGTAMGIFNVIIAFAPTIAPVVAGIVIDMWSWRIMFYAVAILTTIAGVLGAIFLERGGGDPSIESVDKPSVLLSTFGFGGMLYGFSVIGNSGFSAEAIIAITAGAFITVLFFYRQLHLEQPMLRVTVLKNKRFLLATIICMVVQAATFANAILIPVFVQTICGQSATTSALVMLPGSIAMGVLGPVAGRLFDKHGPRVLAIVGLSLTTIGNTMMSMLSADMNLIYLTIYVFIRLCGLSMVNMPITTWGMNVLDNKLIAHGNAVNNTLRQVAGSLGTAIFISVYTLYSTTNAETLGVVEAQVGGVNLAFFLQTILLATALVLAIVFVRNTSVPESTSEAAENKTRLESLMSRDLKTLPEDATVLDVAQFFADHPWRDVVMLVDKDDKLVGVVSDGDLIREIVPKQEGNYVDILEVIGRYGSGELDTPTWYASVMKRPAKSIATTRVITVDVHSDFNEVCRILGGKHLRKAPVLDHGRVVGFITRAAISNYALREYLERTEAANGMATGAANTGSFNAVKEGAD